MHKNYYEELRPKSAKDKKFLIGDCWLEIYFNGPRTLVEERDLAKIYTFAEAVQFVEKYDYDGTFKVSNIDFEDKNDGLQQLYDAFPDSELVIYDNDATYYSIFDDVLSQQVRTLKQVKNKAFKLFSKQFHLSK